MRRKTSHFRRTVNEVRHALIQAGMDPACRVLAGRPDDCWGFWAPSLGVVVNPDLRGRALWIVLLHEFGHALGLAHSRKGLMQMRPLKNGIDQRRPTRAEKEDWVAEIVRVARRSKTKLLEESKLVR